MLVLVTVNLGRETQLVSSVSTSAALAGCYPPSSIGDDSVVVPISARLQECAKKMPQSADRSIEFWRCTARLWYLTSKPQRGRGPVLHQQLCRRACFVGALSAAISESEASLAWSATSSGTAVAGNYSCGKHCVDGAQVVLGSRAPRESVVNRERAACRYLSFSAQC
jgi:hypothetical protein